MAWPSVKFFKTFLDVLDGRHFAELSEGRFICCSKRQVTPMRSRPGDLWHFKICFQCFQNIFKSPGYQTEEGVGASDPLLSDVLCSRHANL